MSRRFDVRGAGHEAGMERSGRRLAVNAAVAVLLIVTGCGTSTTGPTEKVRETVETFLESCAKDQPLAALDVLNEPARKRFVAERSTVAGCRTILALDLAQDLPEPAVRDVFGRTRVVDVAHNGGFATAVVETPDGRRNELEVESSGDLWYLSNPLPAQ